jgi:uncharacterized protein
VNQFPHSAIYEGTVTHHRRQPVEHLFSTRLFHLYIDLAEVDSVFAGTRWWRNERSAPASFRRRDYLPGLLPLDQQVRSLVHDRLGHWPRGAIRLLTHVRFFSLSFNPVSFYYCFAEDGTLDAIIAEITNIPWLERHAYVLDCRGRQPQDLVFELDKRFHISPFMGMDQHYRWRFTVPGKTLSVHMTSLKNDRSLFSASLVHQRKKLTARALDGLLWRYPFISMQVVAGIYGHAARLWWKKVPVYDHPTLTSNVRSPETSVFSSSSSYAAHAAHAANVDGLPSGHPDFTVTRPMNQR